MFELFAWVSIVSFFVYGVSCLGSQKMVLEFQRYGLSRFRVVTGVLQVLGATGMTLGLLLSPWIGFLAATGLALQMLLGFGVRLRIRDPFLQCLPSFAYMWINGGLAVVFYRLGLSQ